MLLGINYQGFPRGLCASPNEVALHGVGSSASDQLSGPFTALSLASERGQPIELQVPNTRPLESGDIVNFDITGT